mgnify:CR=1
INPMTINLYVSISSISSETLNLSTIFFNIYPKFHVVNNITKATIQLNVDIIEELFLNVVIKSVIFTSEETII